jgi:hypothetical protein
MKKVEKTFMATVAAATLALISVPSANAVTPDSLYPLSGYWSSARVMKEYFDWRAYVGWGTIGTTNLLITIGTGASQGQITKAAFQALCGSAAAGTLAVWKPASEPTAASHFKAIMKSGGVVAASSACGWASQFAFNAIDREIVKAQNAINHGVNMNQHDEIAYDARHINDDLLAMESYYGQVARAMSNANAARNQVNQYCRNQTSESCKEARQTLNDSLSIAQAALDSFNRRGVQLHNDLREINHDIPS